MNDEHLVVGVELAKVVATSVVVETEHIVVKPHFATTERAGAFLFERDTMDFVLGDKVTQCVFALDVEFGKIEVKLQHFEAVFRFECDA